MAKAGLSDVVFQTSNSSENTDNSSNSGTAKPNEIIVYNCMRLFAAEEARLEKCGKNDQQNPSALPDHTRLIGRGSSVQDQDSNLGKETTARETTEVADESPTVRAAEASLGEMQPFPSTPATAMQQSTVDQGDLSAPSVVQKAPRQPAKTAPLKSPENSAVSSTMVSPSTEPAVLENDSKATDERWATDTWDERSDNGGALNFNDYWDERWAAPDQPQLVFTLSSNLNATNKTVTEKPLPKAQENRAYTAPFKMTDRLRDLAAPPAAAPPLSNRKAKKMLALETFEAKEKQRQASSTSGNDRREKTKETRPRSPRLSRSPRPCSASTSRVFVPGKRKSDDRKSSPKRKTKASPKRTVEALLKSLPAITEADMLQKQVRREAAEPAKGTNRSRVVSQTRVVERSMPKDSLLMPNWALDNTTVSSDVVSSSAIEHGPESPSHHLLQSPAQSHNLLQSPAQIGLSPPRDPRRQQKVVEEKIAVSSSLQRSPMPVPVSPKDDSAVKTRGPGMPGHHLANDAYWWAIAPYFDALLRTDTQEMFRVVAAPLRQLPIRNDEELPLAPIAKEYVNVMHQYITRDLEDKLKEAVRQSRLTLEDIPMNAQFIDSALDTNHGCFRVNLHGSEDQFKIIHPFDLVLMVFTPQVPGTSSGPPRKLFAFGVVQSCKLREGREWRMRAFVCEQYSTRLGSARLKENPSQPLYNAAVLQLLPLKKLDNCAFGLLSLIGMNSLTSKCHPLTSGWTELSQPVFEFSLPSTRPQFSFDKSKVNGSQREAIEAITECFHPETNRAGIRVVLGAAHTGKSTVLAGALSSSLRNKPTGHFLILVPAVRDLERVAKALLKEWKAIHGSDSERDNLISRSLILLSENDTPPASSFQSTRDILHAFPTFRDMYKSLDQQISSVKMQLATGQSKSSPEVLKAELDRFMKTKNDDLTSAVARTFNSKDREAMQLAVKVVQHVKKEMHLKNVFITPLSFLLESKHQPHINYGLLPLLDGLFVYDAGRFTELELLLAVTRLPAIDSNAPKAALIGDHMSIPLNADGQELPSGGMTSSFLHRFCKRYGLLTHNVSLTLNKQYLVDQEVSCYVNSAYYSNILINKTLKVQSNLPSYQFFDVRGMDHTEKEGQDGMEDAEYTMEFVKILTLGDFGKIGSFVVLTRSASYCQKLRDIVNIEAHTVASFQGNFADTVLFCADAAELKEGDCNWEQKRICQGLSAARERLFILGHAKSLKINKAWSDLIDDAGKRRKRVGILSSGPTKELTRPEKVLERLKL